MANHEFTFLRFVSRFDLFGLPVAFALLLGPSIALIFEGNQVYLDMLTLRLPTVLIVFH